MKRKVSTNLHPIQTLDPLYGRTGLPQSVFMFLYCRTRIDLTNCMTVIPLLYN